MNNSSDDENDVCVEDDVEDVLANFREKWQNELRVTPKNNFIDNRNNTKVEDKEETAKLWYMKGSEMERAGKLYEAIQFYKKAVQLVPDIEFKIREKTKIVQDDLDSDDFHFDNNHLLNETNSDVHENAIKKGALLLKIQRKINKSPLYFIPAFEQKAPHISCLPMEIILYILRWVVSSDLDLRSLELCAEVSRGFYLCARDPEIWKLACIRAFGQCETLPNSYTSWREMFLFRSRLHFNGCYISKTTYIRHGENSFQDQFYRPWHLVTYYRYLRFFPDGVVLMLTTPDEPAQSVSLLKNRVITTGNRNSAIHTGHYRLKDDKVSCIIVQTPQDTPSLKSGYKRGRRKNELLFESNQQTFHLKFIYPEDALISETSGYKN